jgi:hypothetical protein
VGYADHVPAPDPANFWKFRLGIWKTIGINPTIAFKVNKIGVEKGKAFISGTQQLGDQTVHGMLYIDQSVVICRNAINNLPEVTLTLRKTSPRIAYIQVTADTSIPQGPRQ